MSALLYNATCSDNDTFGASAQKEGLHTVVF